MVDGSSSCFRGVVAKMMSGKEDPAQLSMEDCNVTSRKRFNSPLDMERNPGFNDDLGEACE